MRKYWKKVSWRIVKINKKGFHESSLLKLNSRKARTQLKWKCILSFNETIKMVADWYKNYYSKNDRIYKLSLQQIKEYEKHLKKRSI